MPRISFQPDVISCSAPISACKKGVQWETALGLLQEMPRRSLQLVLVSCNGLINACETGTRWACQADVIGCSAAISACEKGMHWENALRLLWEMPCRALLPDMSSYGAAAIAVVRMCEPLTFTKS